MNAAIAIAKHFKINQCQIIKIEEWAKVFFAVIKGLGARFVSKRVVKMEMEAKTITPIYEGIFGQLQLDDKHVDLASTRALVSRDGHKFLRKNFKPGDLLQTANGVQMLDKNFNVLKAGFHEQNPEEAKKRAGLA